MTREASWTAPSPLALSPTNMKITLQAAIAGNKNGMERMKAESAELRAKAQALTLRAEQIETELALREVLVSAMENLAAHCASEKETITLFVPEHASLHQTNP